MKQQFITNTGQSRLLLIFAGWGMDAHPFSNIHRTGYDVAVVWDYSSDHFDSSPYSLYQEVVVMAWSMGVWGAARTIPTSGLPVTLTIAINGTTTPVSNTLGIPVSIFHKTLTDLNQSSLLKFYRRTAGSAAAYKKFEQDLPKRSIAELAAELSHIETSGPASAEMRWDKAIIASHDAIFPPENQLRHWNGVCETIEIDGPHLPDWSKIIDRFLIDKTLVESRFRRSITTTYDDEASVQQRIADHLWKLWQKYIPSAIKPDNMIEIGYGTGAFTRLYTQKLHPVTLQLWDLIPAATHWPGKTVSCDAEIAIMDEPTESADAIVSASTIQWFNSIGAFLQQSLRVLKPGGLLVVSTFGNLTFKELIMAGGTSLPYIDMTSMRALIPKEFEILEFHDGIITKVFNSPIEVLRHIKATGVNAIRHHSSTSFTRAMIANYPLTPDGRAPLTYNPLYFILKKS